MDVFKVKYEEETDGDLYGISIVDDPANGFDFIAMSKKMEIKLATDQKKKILYGIVLRPEQKIYREFEDGTPFQLMFDAPTIERFSQDFMMKGYQKNTTFNHEDNNWLKGTTVVENWIVMDKGNDKGSAVGLPVENGDWCIGMKLSDQLWSEYVDTGKAKGFSIDSFVQFEKINMKKVLLGGPGSGRNPEGGSDDNSSSSDNPAIQENESAVIDKEKEIKGLPTEKGLIVSGGKEVLRDAIISENANSVKVDYNKVATYSADDRAKMSFTHNHPPQNVKLSDGTTYELAGGSFSDNDIQFMIKTGMGEVRAVDKEYTHSMAYIGPKSEMTYDKGQEVGREFMTQSRVANQVSSAYGRLVKKKRQDWQKQNPYDSNTDRATYEKKYYDASREILHTAMEETAKKNPKVLLYKRTKNKH